MYHIILVEDDEQIRKSLTELLTYKGYTVTAVEGAEVL
jgi:CheY-like chemotaxis protein